MTVLRATPPQHVSRAIGLIGAPTDIGANMPGTASGPSSLRAAGLANALSALGLQVFDRGDLAGPPTPWLPPAAGYRHLAQVTAWSRLAHDAVQTEMERGTCPVLMGGDHSLAIGSITAVAHHCRTNGKRLRVLWLDAHPDANTCDTSPSGNLHGMALACLLGFGPPELSGLGSQTPAVHAEEIRLIGTRRVDAGEQRFLQAQHLASFGMVSIHQSGMQNVMEQALAGMDAQTHLHVSLDLDGLDPLIAPGVGTPAPDGIGHEEARLCMELIARTGRLGSLDVVELNPLRDQQDRTAQLAVQLLEHLFKRPPA